MSLDIRWELLQSYLVEEKAINFIKNAIADALNKVDLFSATFDIERLKFGTKKPSIVIQSMKDVDITLQWHLNTHEINLPQLKKTSFQAPFQAVIGIDVNSDALLVFTAIASFDLISPGCIRFPIRASITDIILRGNLTVQFLGDSLILFFETPPEFNFSLDLILGGEQKLYDQTKVRDFVCQVFNDYVQQNLVHPNAIKLPFSNSEME